MGSPFCLLRSLMPTFTPPPIEEGIEVTHGLWRYFKINKGVTVYVDGETVTTERFPYMDDLATHEHVYMGGYVHDISDAEASVLTDAGYGDYVT